MQISGTTSRAIIPHPGPSPVVARWLQMLRSAYAVPRADLRLRVIIPLERLVRPGLLPIAPSRDDSGPLTYFSPSAELDRFSTLLRLPGDVGIQGLSACCDALAMYDGSIARRHEERIPLRMLGYLGHAADRFRAAYPDLVGGLERAAVEALTSNRRLLERIIEYETARERCEYLELRGYGELLQEHYRNRCRRGGTLLEWVDYWVPLNTPANEHLSRIMGSRLIRHRRKVELASRLWRREVSALGRLAAQKSPVVVWHRTVLRDERARRDRLHRRLPRLNAPLDAIGRQIGALFELEGLQRAIGTLDGLTLDRATAREERNVCLEQALVVLREATKLVVSDMTLNAGHRETIRPLARTIKEVRDYLEHPEDYTFRLDGRESVGDWLARLWDELADGGLGRVRDVLHRRVEALQRLFAPHERKDPGDVLTALAERPEETVADAAHELAREQFPILCEMASRLTRGSGRPSMDRDDLLRHLDDLKRRIGGLNRSQFRRRLEENALFRLTVQREIDQCYRRLEADVRAFDREGPVEKVDDRLFEEAFYRVRDARNFQTHDLWRNDVMGTLNVAYLLAYDLLEAAKPWRPFRQDSREAALFNHFVRRGLSREQLGEALDRGFDPNACDYKRRTLLHFIAEDPSEQSLELARLLIGRRANIHAADYLGMRPLHIACQSGFELLASDLLGRGAVADLPSRFGTPMELAQMREEEELARMVAGHVGASRDSEARALLDAVENLDVRAVGELIRRRHRANVPVSGTLPLIALFRKEGADVGTQMAIAELLFRAGADVDQQEPSTRQTAIHAAATYCGDDAVVASLLRRNPSLQLTDKFDRTALHYAVWSRNANWARRLLEAGAPVSARDHEGITPLLGVSNSVCPLPVLTALLLRHGADPEETDEYGTALHSAAERGRPESVELLCRAGASPFIVGWGGKYIGRTPDHQATARARRYLDRWRDYLFDHLEPLDRVELCRRLSRCLMTWAEPGDLQAVASELGLPVNSLLE